MAFRCRRTCIMPGLVILFAGLYGCAGHSPYFKRLEAVTLISYHRMYPAYAETTLAAAGESAPIGDGEHTLRVTDFVPDFQMDERNRVQSASDSLLNPAVKVEVFRGRDRVETNWAFRGAGAPHFRQQSLFAFRIEDLQVKPDSTDREPTDTGE